MNGGGNLNYAQLEVHSRSVVWEVFMQNRPTAFLLQCKFDGKHSTTLFYTRSLLLSRYIATDLNEFYASYFGQHKIIKSEIFLVTATHTHTHRHTQEKLYFFNVL